MQPARDLSRGPNQPAPQRPPDSPEHTLTGLLGITQPAGGRACPLPGNGGADQVVLLRGTSTPTHLPEKEGQWPRSFPRPTRTGAGDSRPSNTRCSGRRGPKVPSAAPSGTSTMTA